jgi:CheY-like chemotaxis protein
MMGLLTEEAAAQFLEYKDGIQLVLCDVIMPGMIGAEIEKGGNSADV